MKSCTAGRHFALPLNGITRCWAITKLVVRVVAAAVVVVIAATVRGTNRYGLT